MTSPLRHRGAGFTLVELLVSVLVFGLLAASAYGGLNALSAAAGAQRERSEAFADLQRAVATLDADLRQLVVRGGRDRQGRQLPAFVADRQSLLGRRAGRINPAGLPRSQLQQFDWRIGPDRLERRSWAEVDTPPDTDPVGRTLFDSVSALDLRYRDAQGGWHRQWPVPGSPEALPTAVEYVLDTPRFGRVRRVIGL
ncbi:MAG: type II secretion system minor pseudopilin GspJ [Wenzhouxiangellaceae bacterium]|nr:type II secretion system minor pseudopilin GspJ [Wenzhouxiangellaceae bacterium]MBS3747286.1 type II secretion system minor pseudopilin GspJ [Wenzhouxiangellaceae bacterium]MBS3823752.1 type II secretion system minor pseudopilin GspJ [Wenzhouxiangellaceae bacterium]